MFSNDNYRFARFSDSLKTDLSQQNLLCNIGKNSMIKKTSYFILADLTRSWLLQGQNRLNMFS